MFVPPCCLGTPPTLIHLCFVNPHLFVYLRLFGSPLFVSVLCAAARYLVAFVFLGNVSLDLFVFVEPSLLSRL